MNENRIENQLIDKVTQIGGYCLKSSSIGFNGMPDRMVLYQGEIFFVELKAPGKKPRKLQKYIHQQLMNKGFNVRTIDSLEGVEEFINEIQTS